MPTTDPEKVKANVRKLVAAGAPEKDIHDYLEASGYPEHGGPPETAKGNVRGALASAYQMATFGLGDKFTAATRAVLPQAMGGTKGFDYSGALKEERAGLDAFQQRHPYVAAASGAIGAIPALVASGGASAAPTLRSSIATGAKYGAMYGAGEPDSPKLEDLLASTGKGAAAGAVTAGLVHGAVRTPGAVLDYTGTRPSRTGTSRIGRIAQAAGVAPVEDRALETVISKMDRAKLAPRDVTKTANEAKALGKPLSMIDVGGDPMVRLARGTQGVPSRGADEIRGALESRRRGAPVRVAGDVEAGFGQNRQDTFETAQKLAEQQKAKAAPLYQKSMKAAPLSLDAKGHETVTLGELLKRPSAQKAIGYESQLAKEEGREAFPDVTTGSAGHELTAKMSPDARARFAELAKAQGIELNPSISMEQAHNLKLRLDEMIGYGKRTNQLLDGTPATKKMLGAMQDTKNQLLAIMDAHEPTYARARRSWAGDAELQDALEMGRDFLNGKRAPSELAHELSQFSDAGKDHARVGVVDAVRDQIDRAPDGADVVRRIFGNEAQRQRLRVAFPDDASFARFKRQMELEANMAKNENTILGNSQTAEKLSDQLDITGQLPSGGNLFTKRGMANALLKTRAALHLQGLARQRVDALSPYLTAGSGAPGTRSLEDVIGAIDQHQRRTLPQNRAGNASRAFVGGAAGRAVSSR